MPGLNEVITQTNADVSWDLKTFPEGEGSECIAASVTDKIDVEIAPMNGKKVTDQITLTTDKGNGTPTGDAIKQAVAYFDKLKATDPNPKYILLATDGEPSCPEGSPPRGRTLRTRSRPRRLPATTPSWSACPPPRRRPPPRSMIWPSQV